MLGRSYVVVEGDNLWKISGASSAEGPNGRASTVTIIRGLRAVSDRSVRAKGAYSIDRNDLSIVNSSIFIRG